MLKLAQVVANTTSKSFPRAISEMLPLVDAQKEFSRLKKAGEWPLKKGAARQPNRPVLELKEDSGKVIDSIKV